MKFLKARFNFPVSEDMKNKVLASISFLENSYALGIHVFMWSCPVSNKLVGMYIERHERQAGEYYREPYPMTIQIVAPEIPGIPHIIFPLSVNDKQELLSALRVELKNKWRL